MAFSPNNQNGSATSANSSPVVIASDQATVPVSLASVPSHAVTNAGTFAVQASAGTNLNTSALALETGGNLATIATRTPALGQALAAASVPVILPSATITTLTPPAAITGFALDATLTGGTQQTKLTDGTHLGTIKAASTAAAATDTAIVVAVSPNNTIPVSLASLPSGAVTNAGTFSVQNTAATPAGTNLMGKVGIDQTTVGTTNAVSLAQLGATTLATGSGVSGAGVQRVNIASDNTAFSVNAIQSGTWTVQPGNTPNTTAWLTTNVPTATGGPTVARIKAAASTNATSVKASAGQIYGWAFYNNTTTAKYVKIYNKASAPTVGTDTPAFTIIVPGGTAAAGTNVEFSNGIPLGTGVAYAITGLITDTDTTSTAVDDVTGVLLYK